MYTYMSKKIAIIGFILHLNSMENDVNAKTLRIIPGIPFIKIV